MTATFLTDPLADLEPLGIVERKGRGWKVTGEAAREYGWAFRELDARCEELEAAGCPERDWSIILVLIELADRLAEDAAGKA